MKRCKCAVTCRHPFWYVFVIKGIRYRRTTRTANRQTAGRIAERRRVAILENRDEEDKPQISLRAHLQDYIKHTAAKNRTAYKDQAVLDRVLSVIGDRPLCEISPFHIEKWKTHRAGAVERSTVNRELNIVRGCFSRAVEWKRLDTSPVAQVRSYAVDGQRIRVLSDDEIRHILTKADPFVALLCRTTIECLPRLSEVLGIHRDHIGPGWIEIRRKGGTIERVLVSNELRTALLHHCAGESGYAFGTEGVSGKVPSQQLASLRVVREFRRLGITGASHHTARHTGVTLMLEAGVNPRVIQKLAGWSSLRMLERYGHARDTEIRRAVTVNAEHLRLLSESQPEIQDIRSMGEHKALVSS